MNMKYCPIPICVGLCVLCLGRDSRKSFFGRMIKPLGRGSCCESAKPRYQLFYSRVRTYCNITESNGFRKSACTAASGFVLGNEKKEQKSRTFIHVHTVLKLFLQHLFKQGDADLYRLSTFLEGEEGADPEHPVEIFWEGE